MLTINVMNQGDEVPSVRGIVLSDLHLFARRSQAADCMHRLRTELATVRVLVLNGDIFDFRWSTLRDLETTVAAALERGVLVYSGTGMADGVDGDTILLGPPFVVTDDELVRIADVVSEAIEATTADVAEPVSPGG